MTNQNSIKPDNTNSLGKLVYEELKGVTAFKYRDF